MHWVSRIATALFILALPTLLVTSNVRYLAGESKLYERGFRAHDSDVRTGLALPELDRAAGEIIEYFEDDREFLRIRVTDGGDEVSLFSDRETRHMADVKTLIRAVFRLNEVSLAYVLAYVAGVYLWAGNKSLRRLGLEALSGIGVGLALVLMVLGTSFTVGFDRTWNGFHEIAFRNDLWKLDPDSDRLLQMFPEPFWEETTYLLGAMTIAEVLLIVIGAGICLWVGRTRPLVAEGPVRVRPIRG